MTTTATRTAGAQSAPAPAPAVEFVTPYRRGTWIARIYGPHGRYGLDREFLRGRTNRRERRITYRLRPGWYEYQHEPGRREIIAVDSIGQIHTLPHPGTDPDRLRPIGKAARRGGLIDTPGEYGSARCWCDRPAVGPAPVGTKAEGRGRCVDHMPPPADEPPPPPVYDPIPDVLDDYEPEPDIPAEWLTEWLTEERSAA